MLIKWSELFLRFGHLNVKLHHPPGCLALIYSKVILLSCKCFNLNKSDSIIVIENYVLKVKNISIQEKGVKMCNS